MTDMDITTIPTALSVGSAVVVTIFTVIVVPLVRYVIAQKDDQVASLKEALGRAFKRVDQLEAQSRHNDELLKDRLAELEKQAAVMRTEVSLVSTLREDIGKLSDRVGGVVAEIAELKAVISERSGGSNRPNRPKLDSVHQG